MAEKRLKGYINLSKIPKNLITTSQKSGNKFLDIEIAEMQHPSPYGDTHYIKVWGRGCGTVYIGNLKFAEFGSVGSLPDQQGQAEQTPAPQATQEAQEGADDLPF